MASIFRSKLSLAQITGSFGTGHRQINDQLASLATGSIDAQDLSGSLSHMASAIKRIHGTASFSEAAAGTFYQNLTIDTAGAASLTIGGGADADMQLNFNQSGQDFYVGVENGIDDLVFGRGSDVGASQDMILDGSGNVTVSNNLTVNGDLDVNGSVTTIDTVNLQVQDRIIELAAGNPGNTQFYDYGLVMNRNANDVSEGAINVADGNASMGTGADTVGGEITIKAKDGEEQTFFLVDDTASKATGAAIAQGDLLETGVYARKAGIAVDIGNGGGGVIDQSQFLEQLSIAITDSASAILSHVLPGDPPPVADGAQSLVVALSEAGTDQETITFGIAPRATITISGNLDTNQVFTIKDFGGTDRTVGAAASGQDAQFTKVDGNNNTTASNIATAINSLAQFSAVAASNVVYIQHAQTGTGGNTKTISTSHGEGVTNSNTDFANGAAGIANVTLTAFSGTSADSFPGNVAMVFDESSDTLKFHMTSNTAADDRILHQGQAALPVQVDQLAVSGSSNFLSYNSTTNLFQMGSQAGILLLPATGNSVSVANAASEPGKVELMDNDSSNSFYLKSAEVINNDLGFIFPATAGATGQLLSITNDGSRNMTIGYTDGAITRNTVTSVSLNQTIAPETDLKGADPALRLEFPAGITNEQLSSSVQVFFNGQLLLSGSNSAMQGGTADYHLLDAGATSATTDVEVNATGVGTIADGDTLTLQRADGGSDNVLTARSSGAGANEFNIAAGNNNTTAENLRAAIQAITGFTATRTDNVVTITQSAGSAGTGKTCQSSRLTAMFDPGNSGQQPQNFANGFNAGRDIRCSFQIEPDDVIVIHTR